MPITERDVEKAVDWLRDNAESSAQSRANRVYLESWVKVVLAEQMKLAGDIPISAQERDARCSEAYRDALKALHQAVQEDARNSFLREAAAAKIEAWRTQQATARAEGKAYS